MILMDTESFLSHRIVFCHRMHSKEYHWGYIRYLILVQTQSWGDPAGHGAFNQGGGGGVQGVTNGYQLIVIWFMDSMKNRIANLPNVAKQETLEDLMVMKDESPTHVVLAWK